MLPEAEELTNSIHDLLYGISGMALITGGCVGIITRNPLKIIIGSIPLVIALIVLNGLIIEALMSILGLLFIAYLVLVYIQPESEADDPPTIDTLRGGAAFNQVADQMRTMTPEQRDEFIATTPRGGQPVIVSASSAAPKVLDDVAGDVKPGKRKVILD